MPGPRHVWRTGSAGRLRAAHVRPLPCCGIFIVRHNGKRARRGLDPSAQVFNSRSIHPLRPGSWQQQRGGQIRKIQRQTHPPLPALQLVPAQRREQQHQRHGGADGNFIAAELRADGQFVAVHQAGNRQRQRQVQDRAVQKLDRQRIRRVVAAANREPLPDRAQRVIQRLDQQRDTEPEADERRRQIGRASCRERV